MQNKEETKRSEVERNKWGFEKRVGGEFGRELDINENWNRVHQGDDKPNTQAPREKFHTIQSYRNRKAPKRIEDFI